MHHQTNYMKMSQEELWTLHGLCMDHLATSTGLPMLYTFHMSVEQDAKMIQWAVVIERSSENNEHTTHEDTVVRITLTHEKGENICVREMHFTSFKLLRTSMDWVKKGEELHDEESKGRVSSNRMEGVIPHLLQHVLTALRARRPDTKDELRFMMARVPVAQTLMHRLEHILSTNHPALTREVRQFLDRHLLDPK